MSFERGFSLVELLMVIGLLAILSVGALAGFWVQISKARDAERLSELDTWSKALFTYQDDHGCYPDEVEMSCGSVFLQPYLSQVPCDPIDNETYKYTYSKTDCNTYYIYARLENEADEKIARVGCSGGCGPSLVEQDYNYFVSSPNVGVSPN